MGERYSSRCFGQLAKLGQHRLQKEPRQNHSRYLPDRTQPLQGHATRYLIAIFLENCRGDFTNLLFAIRWSQKESQIQVCFQDFDEDSSCWHEKRSWRFDQQENHDFGLVRNFGPVHMGTSQILVKIMKPKTIEHKSWILDFVGLWTVL